MIVDFQHHFIPRELAKEPAGTRTATRFDKDGVPSMTANSVLYDLDEHIRMMDAAGIDYAVLYPTVAGVGGQTFGRIEDPELELACVQAYNDWLLETWGGASDRFVPQCITRCFRSNQS